MLTVACEARQHHLKQQLYRRIVQLESKSIAQIGANLPDLAESARQKVREYLQASGIEQSPMEESFMETLARALGITCRELLERLRAPALGGALN
jgi:hypothetical protein